MRAGEKAILPLWFRTGLILALLVTIGLSYSHRQTTDSARQQPMVDNGEHGSLVASRKLHFVDLEEGGISVVDANDGSEITRLQTGEDGFMRSVMRGFVRQRRAQGIGPEIPFELALWETGLMSMIDPATARRVELSAFGIDNVGAFARLLPASETANTVLPAASSS